MPRETIGIPVGQDPLYEASAAFLAVLAHPSSETHRIQFYRALCRSTILQLAEQDAAFAWSRQFIKPGYFLMDDAACSAALKHGGAELSERKAAAVSTWVLFDEALLALRSRQYARSERHTAILPDTVTSYSTFGATLKILKPQ
jgi:hypothetical protein